MREQIPIQEKTREIMEETVLSGNARKAMEETKARGKASTKKPATEAARLEIAQAEEALQKIGLYELRERASKYIPALETANSPDPRVVEKISLPEITIDAETAGDPIALARDFADSLEPIRQRIDKLAVELDPGNEEGAAGKINKYLTTTDEVIEEFGDITFKYRKFNYLKREYDSVLEEISNDVEGSTRLSPLKRLLLSLESGGEQNAMMKKMQEDFKTIYHRDKDYVDGKSSVEEVETALLSMKYSLEKMADFLSNTYQELEYISSEIRRQQKLGKTN
ncbi:MAG: hypothetical protein ABII72_01710 [Parcubacteria group bacterium]